MANIKKSCTPCTVCEVEGIYSEAERILLQIEDSTAYEHDKSLVLFSGLSELNQNLDKLIADTEHFFDICKKDIKGKIEQSHKKYVERLLKRLHDVKCKKKSYDMPNKSNDERLVLAKEIKEHFWKYDQIAQRIYAAGRMLADMKNPDFDVREVCVKIENFIASYTSVELLVARFAKIAQIKVDMIAK